MGIGGLVTSGEYLGGTGGGVWSFEDVEMGLLTAARKLWLCDLDLESPWDGA